MATASVNVTDFRTEIPGELAGDGKTWEFPEVKYTSGKGAERFFRIFLQVRPRAEQGNAGAALRIRDKHYLPEKFPADLVAVLWTESGQTDGKTTTSSDTVVSSGKNMGKKNATTPWTQAMRDGLTRYNKAAQKHRPVPAAAEGDDAAAADAIDVPVAVPPMLLQKIADHPPKTWPQYIQVKYNGVRAMAYRVDPHVLAKLTVKSRAAHIERAQEVGAVLVSRMMAVIPAWHIAEALMPFFDRWPSVALDGELVAYQEDGHELPLQEISGMARNDASADGLSMVVFDAYDREAPAQPFRERWQFLANEAPRLAPLAPVVTLAETELVDNELEAIRIHDSHLARGLEGSVVRAPDGVYVPSYNTMRSRDVLKWKPRHSAEFEIVGFKPGRKGKCADAIMWVVRIPAHANGSARAVPKDIAMDPKNMTMDERRQMLKDFNAQPRLFEEKYLGQPMTVEFFEWSQDGIPLQPKAVATRPDGM